MNSLPEVDTQWIENRFQIVNNWESYFKNPDEGLGTTYERFILHRFFEDIHTRQQIESVIEVPSFGMTGVSGINSLWWAQQGIQPLIVDSDKHRINLMKDVWNNIPLKAEFLELSDFSTLPLEDNSFDFSWNFASLWFVENLEKFLTEMARITKKTIFISVPNRAGLGFLLRFGIRLNDYKGFYLRNIIPARIEKTLKSNGWRQIKKGYFDIPPWPDIPMKKEDMLRKAGLGFLVKSETDQQSENSRTCIIDYFNGKRPQLDKEIMKYSVLENFPPPVRQLWGHHRYFIFEPEN